MIISTDGLLALFVMLIIFISAAGYVSKASSESVESLNLKRFTMDSVSTLEKSGELERAILKNKPNRLRQFLNKLPNSYCATINLYSSDDLNNADMSVAKPSCKTSGEEVVAIKRSFVVRNGSDANFFVAKMIAWYKVNQ